MKARSTQRKKSAVARASHRAGRSDYRAWSGGIAALLEESRRQAARSVNAILTATYWEIGRRIVEFVQQGESRADYGDEALAKLSQDLTGKFGRGFAPDNLERMRSFYLGWPPAHISATVSRKSGSSEMVSIVADNLPAPISATASRKSEIDLALHLEALTQAFPLSWSHYVRLLSVENLEARRFYEAESLRGGWSVRQLDRQVGTLFYERTALGKNQSRIAAQGTKIRAEDVVSVEEEIKSPYVLEFLNLSDNYAESELEKALVSHLEAFLLELGNDFTFVARQKRIRVGKQWYRIDLLLFHRRLRCLFVFDLKLGRFTHADAGQMNLYVNYAAEHLTLAGENPPVGLILCSEHDVAVARYSMGNLTNKILAAQYKLTLPDPQLVEKEIEKTRRILEAPERRMHQRQAIAAQVKSRAEKSRK